MMHGLISIAAQHPPATRRRPCTGRSSTSSTAPGRLALTASWPQLADVDPPPGQGRSGQRAGERHHRDRRRGRAPARQPSTSDAPRSTCSSTTSSGSATSARRTTISASPRYGEEKPASPSKLFGEHPPRRARPSASTRIVWCDSLNNLNRTFDRQALREFEIRVLFQMSSDDSSTLIDSPAAGKLGPNRALFFSEEQGRLEKFRPYGLPATSGWTAWPSSRRFSKLYR